MSLRKMVNHLAIASLTLLFHGTCIAKTYPPIKIDDSTPDAFNFDAANNVELLTIITSNTVVISGINTSALVSILGSEGQYSVNNAKFTSETGKVNNGDKIRVRLKSESEFSTTVQSTLTVGGVMSVFSVTTTTAPTDNTAPIAKSASFSLPEDNTKSFALDAFDAEGDALTFELVETPMNGSITGEIPSLIYTPNENFFGSDQLRFIARDGELDSAIATVEFNVQAVNDPPVFVSSPLAYAEESSDYTYQVEGQDVDSAITFELEISPPGMQIDNESGLLTWSIGEAFHGKYPVSITLSDSEQTVRQTFELRVIRSENNPAEDPPTPPEGTRVNALPFIGFNASHSLLAINEPKTVTFSARLASSFTQEEPSLEIYQADVLGNLVTKVGELNDMGNGSDLKALDGIYNGSIDVLGEHVETRYYLAKLTLPDEESEARYSRILPIDITPKPYSWPITEEDIEVPNDGSTPFLADIVMVMLHDHVELEMGELLAQRYKAEIIGFGGRPVTYALKLTADTPQSLDEVIAELDEDARVDVAIKAYEHAFQANNDAQRLKGINANRTWHYDQIDAFFAWDILEQYLEDNTLSPVHVGVIDTPVHLDHPDLREVEIVGAVDPIGKNHGTSVLGLIAAQNNFLESNGILPGVVRAGSTTSQIPLKVSLGNSWRPAVDIQRTIYHGAPFINMSYGVSADWFGVNETAKERRIHERLFSRNSRVLFITSAGNSHRNVEDVVPAGISTTTHPNLFVVGGTELTSAGDAIEYYDTNFGNNLTLSAPAERIWVPINPPSTTTHKFSSGTSFSAPLVTGASALLRSIDPTLQIKQIRKLLYGTGDTIRTLREMNGPMPNTSRVLNIGDAVDCIIEQEEQKIVGGAGRLPSSPDPAGSLDINIPALDAQMTSGFNTPLAAGPDGSLYYAGSIRVTPQEQSLMFIRKIDSQGIIRKVYEEASLSLARSLRIMEDGTVLFRERGFVLSFKPGLDASPSILLATSSNDFIIQAFDVTSDGTIYYVEGPQTELAPYTLIRRDVDGTTTTIADVSNFIIRDLEVMEDGTPYLLTTEAHSDGLATHILKVQSDGTLGLWFSLPREPNSHGFPTASSQDFDIDKNGNFYVAEQSFQKLYKISPEKNIQLLRQEAVWPNGPRGASVTIDKGCRVYFFPVRTAVLHQFN